ncbi:GAK5 protein, partial [Promerops cafer]|nr:GAK5 protein [Promerops cafer]
IAEAFAAMRGPPGTSGVCFSCGKPRHFKRDCSALKGAKPQAPEVCPQCHKGPHFAKQCHSKYDSEGRPVQENRNQSAGRQRCTLTQMPQLPSQIPTPQMPPPQTPHGGSPQVFA